MLTNFQSVTLAADRDHTRAPLSGVFQPVAQPLHQRIQRVIRRAAAHLIFFRVNQASFISQMTVS